MVLYQIMCRSNEKGIDGESIYVGCERFRRSEDAEAYAMKYYIGLEWYIEQIQ